MCTYSAGIPNAAVAEALWGLACMRRRRKKKTLQDDFLFEPQKITASSASSIEGAFGTVVSLRVLLVGHIDQYLTGQRLQRQGKRDSNKGKSI